MANLDEFASTEEEERIDVDAIHIGTIVGEHGCKRTAHNVTSVDHRDPLPTQSISIRQARRGNVSSGKRPTAAGLSMQLSPLVIDFQVF